MIFGAGLALPQQSRLNLDILYEPSPTEVVNEMLKLAKVQKHDVVYDLGCGDGRIVIAAAKQYGASGVGVDIDPKRIEEARINAKKAGVEDKVKFFEQDLFKTEIARCNSGYVVSSL
jgi:methylase of polypeptide subunit release factors